MSERPEPLTDCTGAFTCSAPIHIHGCLADWTGARCDAPQEHSDRRREAT